MVSYKSNPVMGLCLPKQTVITPGHYRLVTIREVLQKMTFSDSNFLMVLLLVGSTLILL